MGDIGEHGDLVHLRADGAVVEVDGVDAVGRRDVVRDQPGLRVPDEEPDVLDEDGLVRVSVRVRVRVRARARG